MSVHATSAFPMELFLIVASFVDRRSDLLALAFTCRGLYDNLVPGWVDFIELDCQLNPFDDLWAQFSRRPFLCDRVRALKLTDSITLYRAPIEDNYKIHNSQETLATPSQILGIYDVLSNLRNLKRFRGSFGYSSKTLVNRLTECLARSGCQLEELELELTTRPWNCSQTSTYLKLPVFLSFAFDFSSLSKLSIMFSDYDYAEADNFIRVVSDLPALTHLSLCPPSRDDCINYLLRNLFQCNWPKLKHMTIRQIYQPNVITEVYSPTLQNVFRRHPELETFHFDNILVPGCLPLDVNISLKSIHFMLCNPETAVSVPVGKAIPSHIARNLTHLSLIGASGASLNIEENGLSSLRTCSLPRIVSKSQLSWMAEFVNAAPNLEKCSVSISLCFGITTIVEVVQLLSSLTKLTHLLNLLTNVNVAEEPGITVLNPLKHMPALLYINATVPDKGKSLIRVLRSPLTDLYLGYEVVSIPLANRESDHRKWGNFF